MNTQRPAGVENNHVRRHRRPAGPGPHVVPGPGRWRLHKPDAAKVRAKRIDGSPYTKPSIGTRKAGRRR